MEAFGYIGALVMGLSLGLIGGGGSILTVPILVYLFSIDALVATSYSLLVVGTTSLVGSLSHIIQGNVNWKTAFTFGIPSVISVFITRLFIVPIIPQNVLQWGGFLLTKQILMLILFALLMVYASISMISERKESKNNNEMKESYNGLMIIIKGFFVGLITGLVGAGGGFLIIPALVILAKLTMKQAVGTSLIIITINSLFGFLSNHKDLASMPWQFLLSFVGIAILGIIIGSIFSKKVPNEKLKPAFGYFVLVMGIYIITKEVFFHHA